MTVQTHTRCDNCEAMIYVTQDEDEDVLDQLAEQGWYTVYPPEDDEAQFCSKRCLAVWACVNAKEEIGLVP